ncbi:MAG: hypothetical protein HYU66_14680 [Armatimonadetes bacterium]|nr:hypothetical protein [Armatimonadota bacterium]
MLTCKLDSGAESDSNQASSAFTAGTYYGLRLALPLGPPPQVAASSATLHQIPGGVSPCEEPFRLVELGFAGPILALGDDLVGPLLYLEQVVSEFRWRGRLADLPRDRISVWIDAEEP